MAYREEEEKEGEDLVTDAPEEETEDEDADPLMGSVEEDEKGWE